MNDMANLEPIIGGLAAFFIGFLWYGVVFKSAWQVETGITDKEAQKGMALQHGGALLMMIVLSFGINFIINMHPVAEQTMAHGAFHGAMAAGGFAVPLMVINYLYQKRSFKLMLIDGLYGVVFCAVSGGVMAALQLGAATTTV